MHGRYWCLLSSIATVKRVNLSNARVFFRNQMNAVSLKFPCHSFGGGKLQVFFSFFFSVCLCEHASLSLWGMTCLVVEGSSCALDLVCVVLPCPVIGSRLLAAACAGGLQPGRNPSTVSYGELSACQALPTMLLYTAVWQNMPLQPGQCAISLHFQDPNWFLNNVGSRRLRGKW